MLAHLRALAQTLCPETCPRCGEQSSSGFCAPCGDDFARVIGACPACGLAGPAHECPAASPDWRLDAVRAPFAYSAPLAVYIQRLKFSRQHRLGRALGLMLARELDGTGTGNGTGCHPLAANAFACDLLVPVPLHPKRLRERTFNQADLIAQPIARRFGIPLKVAGIRRALHTPAQTGLTRAERLVSLERAFSVRCRLGSLRVAIVDDVITTGATVNALAAALKAAGASRVEAWGIARTAADGAGTPVAAQAPRNR